MYKCTIMEEIGLGLHIVGLLLGNVDFVEEEGGPGCSRNAILGHSLDTSVLFSILMISVWLLLVYFFCSKVFSCFGVEF